VSRASLEAAIPAGDRLLLDSTALIAYLNGGEPASPVINVVIDDFVRSGRNTAVVSTVTAMEILIQPVRLIPGPDQHVLNFLSHFPNLTAVDVDLDVALRAANVHVFAGYSQSDALVIASGFGAGVGHLITTDDRWGRLVGFSPRQLQVCYLMDHLPL
jgi:predicted nucleic acid-binding protein